MPQLPCILVLPFSVLSLSFLSSPFPLSSPLTSWLGLLLLLLSSSANVASPFHYLFHLSSLGYMNKLRPFSGRWRKGGRLTTIRPPRAKKEGWLGEERDLSMGKYSSSLAHTQKWTENNEGGRDAKNANVPFLIVCVREEGK